MQGTTGRILRENEVAPASAPARCEHGPDFRTLIEDVSYWRRAAHPRMSLDRTAFRARHGRTISRLYAASEAGRWRVSVDTFEAALHESVTHRFAEAPSAPDVERYLESLHVTDVGLACACRAGD